MVLQYVQRFWWVTILPASLVVGIYLDRRETRRFSGWKNKTELYRRELKPGEDPWKAY